MPWILLISMILFFSQPSKSQVTCAPSESANGRILLLGDSHSMGTFGNQFRSQFPSTETCSIAESLCKPEVTRCGRSGINASGVLSAATTERVLRQNFSAAVIALGTNDAGYQCGKSAEDSSWNSIQDLVKKVPNDKPCFWIGPPNFDAQSIIINQHCSTQQRYNEFVRILAAKVETARSAGSQCRFIDSRQMLSIDSPDAQQPCGNSNSNHTDRLQPNAGDRLHFSGNRAKNWARCAAQIIAEITSGRVNRFQINNFRLGNSPVSGNSPAPSVSTPPQQPQATPQQPEFRLAFPPPARGNSSSGRQ